MKKTKNKQPNKFVEFINNPKIIIIALIALCLFLLLSIVNLKNKHSFYTGQINSNELGVAEIHYYTDPTITYFFANAAVYGGEDKDIYDIEIKYYIEVNGKEYVIDDLKKTFDKKTSLREMILMYSKVNIVDLKDYSQKIFNQTMKDNIKKTKLVILASSTKDLNQDIKLEYDIELNKVNK